MFDLSIFTEMFAITKNDINLHHKQAWVIPKGETKNRVLCQVNKVLETINMGIEANQIHNFKLVHTADEISFDRTDGNGSYYTNINISPFTEKGKDKKFPVTINFMNNEQLGLCGYTFGGKIFLQSGDIGKAEIVSSYQRDLYKIKVERIDEYRLIVKTVTLLN